MSITLKFFVNMLRNSMVKNADNKRITFYNSSVIHIKKDLKYF